MKVLVVDDTLTMLMTISAMVENNGHKVVTASNGREALEMFVQEMPDLILLDILMPELDGYEVAAQIRALSGQNWVPIIFLSSLIDDDDIARGIAAGGDDYLTKPASQTVLAAKLHAMQRLSDMRARLVNVSLELEHVNRQLQGIIHLDGLTGIANRRHFDSMLMHEWCRSMRSGKAVSVLIIDVDHFKAYNDHYGHMSGDNCLARIAHVMREQAKRSTDIVARYGGEEFAVILPETPVEGAQLVAERLRQAVAGLHIAHAGAAVASEVTVSIGGAAMTAQPKSKPDPLVEAADRALYEAKRLGRNRIVIDGQPQQAAA